MKRLILTLFFIICCASISFAQTTYYPKNEVFAGYSYLRETGDTNGRNLHGIALEYTRNIRQRLGITVDFSGHFSRTSIPITGGEVSIKRERYNLLVGPRYNARSDSRVTPFVHALFGIGHSKIDASVISTSGNTFTFGKDTAFAMALGGGLDVKANEKISIRVIQVDYNPLFSGDNVQNNVRLSVGIVFK
jgi:opacity protein-like surface antigen